MKSCFPLHGIGVFGGALVYDLNSLRIQYPVQSKNPMQKSSQTEANEENFFFHTRGFFRAEMKKNSQPTIRFNHFQQNLPKNTTSLSVIRRFLRAAPFLIIKKKITFATPSSYRTEICWAQPVLCCKKKASFASFCRLLKA